MFVLLLIIAAVLLVGAAVVRTVIVTIIALIAVAGLLAYVSISTGWPHWVTISVITASLAALGALFFWFEDMRAKETVRKIQEQRRQADSQH